MVYTFHLLWNWKLFNVVCLFFFDLQYATKAAATSAAKPVPQDTLNGEIQTPSTWENGLVSPKVPSVQTEDIESSEPITLHFRHAEQLVDVKAGSIAQDLTLFMPKRNEVFSIHVPHTEQVTCVC